MPKKTSQPKTLIWIIVILVVLAIAVGSYFYFNSRPSSEQSSLPTPENQSLTEIQPTTPGATTETKNFSEDYPSVPADNLFVYRTGPEIVDILRHGTGVVFIGFKECGWCQAYAPILNEVATEVGLNKIYYFDVLNDRKENTETYQQIVALLGDNLDFDDEGQPRIFVPDVTFVKNGEIIGHNNDTSMNTTAEHGTPEEFWTPKRIADLKAKLRADMITIKPETCSADGSICN